jgi:phosphohistidine phosphatase
MDLYLLRHAIAVERGAPGYEVDSTRPLTPQGTQRMWQIAEGMKALGLSFELILTSPYARAKQTADVVADALKLKDIMEFSANLVPGGDLQALIEELNKRGSKLSSVILVGHEPSLSELISLLVTGNAGSAIRMKKGGLCLLTVGTLHYGQCATLEWLLTPAQMTRIR